MQNYRIVQTTDRTSDRPNERNSCAPCAAFKFSWPFSKNVVEPRAVIQRKYLYVTMCTIYLRARERDIPTHWRWMRRGRQWRRRRRRETATTKKGKTNCVQRKQIANKNCPKMFTNIKKSKEKIVCATLRLWNGAISNIGLQSRKNCDRSPRFSVCYSFARNVYAFNL